MNFNPKDETPDKPFINFEYLLKGNSFKELQLVFSEGHDVSHSPFSDFRFIKEERRRTYTEWCNHVNEFKLHDEKFEDYLDNYLSQWKYDSLKIINEHVKTISNDLMVKQYLASQMVALEELKSSIPKKTNKNYPTIKQILKEIKSEIKLKDEVPLNKTIHQSHIIENQKTSKKNSTIRRKKFWAFFEFRLGPYASQAIYDKFRDKKYWSEKYKSESITNIQIKDAEEVLTTIKVWDSTTEKHVTQDLTDTFHDEYKSMYLNEIKRILEELRKKIKEKTKKKAKEYLFQILSDAYLLFQKSKKIDDKINDNQLEAFFSDETFYLKYLIQEIFYEYPQLTQDKTLDLFLETDVFTNFSDTELVNLGIIPKTEIPETIEEKRTLIKGFGYTGSSKVLEELYNFELNEGTIINQNKTSLESFKSVFTESDLSNIDPNSAIHFNLPITQASAFLFALKRSFIPKLKFTTIKNSKLFFTENGALLTDSNITRNKNKELIEEILKEIDNQIKK